MPGLEGGDEEARGNGSHPVSTMQQLLTAFAFSDSKERGLSGKQKPKFHSACTFQNSPS